MEQIYENLMKKYYRTGRIGNVRPFNIKHAEKIAYAAAVSMFKRGR